MTVKELIEKRRTIRKFSQTPVERALLEKYVELASVAPSGANLQPLKYITVSEKEYTDKVFPLVKWAGYLAPEYNPKNGEEPAAYIIVLADSSVRENGIDMDVGAAVENIILGALEDGIGTCWMGAVDREKISEIFKLPSHLKVSCVLAMGYPMEKPKKVEMKDGNVKYFLDGETLCVPKRAFDEILIGKY